MIMSLTISIELYKPHVPSSKQLSTIPMKSITPGPSDSKQVVQNIFSIRLFGYDNSGRVLQSSKNWVNLGQFG